MPSHKHLRTGVWGEKLAGIYLKLKGYKILERNWRSAYGEADILCIKRSELVCVEVKTRKPSRAGIRGIHAVDHGKLLRLKATCEAYMDSRGSALARQGISDYRVDVLELYLNRLLLPRITHTQNLEF